MKWMLILICALAASAAWAQPTVVVEWNRDLETRSWGGYYLGGSRDRGVVLTETEQALGSRYSALPPAGSFRDRARMRELQRQQSAGQRGRNRLPIDKMNGADFICFVVARTTGSKYRETYSRFMRNQSSDITVHVDLELMEVLTGKTVKCWSGEGSSRARSRDQIDWRPIVNVATRRMDRDMRDAIRIFAPRETRDERSDRQRMWAEVIASAVQNALTDAHVVAPQLLSAGK